eukprot:scaffold292215_cov37-Prasinocladus_malaysianus.AAC.1
MEALSALQQLMGHVQRGTTHTEASFNLCVFFNDHGHRGKLSNLHSRREYTRKPEVSAGERGGSNVGS